MNILVLGLLLFIGVHSIRMIAPQWRAWMLSRLGVMRWRGLYSLLSIAGFVLLIQGYGIAREGALLVWLPPAWAHQLTLSGMLLSAILMTAYFLRRSHVAVLVHHPMVLGVALFSAAHLAFNATLPEIVLFGTFLAWSVLNLVSSYRRDRREGTTYPAPRWIATVLNVVSGAMIWFGFAQGAHLWLVGVSPI